MKTICLNMIVKNESHVIERCLNALKNQIDYWVIVDTGSTDGTQEIIRKCLAGHPGELHEKTWVDFEHNRNVALNLAQGKCDYLLFVDADEVLHFNPTWSKKCLTKDCYLLKIVSENECLYFPKLVRDDSLWQWTHVLHEFIQHKGYVDGVILSDLWVQSVQDGARARDPQKIYKDIEILKKAILKEPQNARYYFYLARSYETAKIFSSALETYKIRASMPGDWDETFWSLFYIGIIEERLNMDPRIYLKSYDKAHRFDPSRAEPLERIANYYFQNEYISIAYCIMKEAQNIPAPKPLTSGYFDWVYDFAVYSVCADCAFKLGKLEEAKTLYQKILRKEKFPKGLYEHICQQLQKIEKALENNEPCRL